ncbi:ion channel [Winogradskyella sp. MIT101101]|uniref:ion channel n=1 Tax=Winogradskyella sp. MIT101101 TaxID=3098297 RepID=UPI00399A226E
MKKLLLLLLLVLSISSFSHGQSSYKEYSYTEFFELIKQEQDTVFKLNNALIKYNPETDQRFTISNKNVYEARDTSYVYRNDIVIDKVIELDNVQFLATEYRVNGKTHAGGVLLDIYFKKPVQFYNTNTLTIRYCRFDSSYRLDTRNCDSDSYLTDVFDAGIDISYSNFTDFFQYMVCTEGSEQFQVLFRDNTFKSTNSKDRFFLSNSNISSFGFDKNFVDYEDIIFMGLFDTKFNIVRNNIFNSSYIQMNLGSTDIFQWFDNSYSSTVFVTRVSFSSNDIIDLEQFKKGISNYSGLMDYSLQATNKYPIHQEIKERSALVTKYLDSVRLYNEKAFREEMSHKSQFYKHFKSRYNSQIANQIYIDLKDFETQRLKIEYNLNPSFRSYFKWKVNQFLKLFSDYGTEPSKAIVVSVYVILAFALIYLFFPNTWDSHGKNRIMNRYRFFTKYMNKDAGMHEVYLEEQQQELLAAEDFKNYMQAAEKTIPKFFITTAMPIYRWSVSGTRFSAAILKQIDVMRGTWKDLPKSKQVWKSFLLIAVFVIAILYDLFIKILNALMLSINTFTTLGFGEIPIKGLPRYLAIIQGFIGWFMLTIFSVSLISQLLN